MGGLREVTPNDVNQHSRFVNPSVQNKGIELPCDFPHRKASGCEYENTVLELTAVQYNVLVALSHETGKTVPVVSLAIFAALLYRLSQQTKLPIGVKGNWGNVISNNDGELSQQIIHFEFDNKTTFNQLLEQSVGGDNLTRQTDNADMEGINVLFCTSAEVPRGISMDLAFQLDIAEPATRFLVWYNKKIFRPERVREFLEQFFVLLEGISWDQQCEIDEHSLLTDNARDILPNPEIKLEEPFLPLVTESILCWADRTPQAPAIHHKGQVWTYADIQFASNSVATALLAAGLQSGEIVGVLGERGGRLYLP